MEVANFPLAVMLEKAGYQLLEFKYRTKKVYNLETNKLETTGVAYLEVIPNKNSRMFFIEEDGN